MIQQIKNIIVTLLLENPNNFIDWLEENTDFTALDLLTINEARRATLLQEYEMALSEQAEKMAADYSCVDVTRNYLRALQACLDEYFE